MSTVSRTNYLRISLIVALLLMLVLGLVLGYLVQRPKLVTYSVDTDLSVCQQNYSLQLAPGQTSTMNCNVEPNYWVAISLASSLNLSVSVWLNSTAGVTTLLYTGAGNNISRSVPILTSGVVIAQVQSPQTKLNGAQGQVTVFRQVPSTFVEAVRSYPYRTIGYPIIAFSILGMFLLIWNPRRVATKSLDWFSYEFRSKGRDQT